MSISTENYKITINLLLGVLTWLFNGRIVKITLLHNNKTNMTWNNLHKHSICTQKLGFRIHYHKDTKWNSLMKFINKNYTALKNV